MSQVPKNSSKVPKEAPNEVGTSSAATAAEDGRATGARPVSSSEMPPPPRSEERATDAIEGSDELEELPDQTSGGEQTSVPPLAIPANFSIRRGAVLGGRFRVNQLIGAGSQSFVYSAEHTTLKSPVAIKCLQPELVTPELVERFAREARALTAIRNPHVATVIDVGRAPCGTPFMVMEYLAGGDLAALLQTRTRLEPRQAAEIVLQTCEGLAAAHALDLVHQDIKPSNIFLSNEMGIVKAKLVDFGVARVAVHGGTRAPDPRFTHSGIDESISGTPFYMSPEQLTGNSVIDERSDIFSLGMVFYEMLRGTHAFDLEMSTRPDGGPVRIDRAGLDPHLADIIETCLADDPNARFDSIAEVAVALLPFAPARARAHVEAAIALLQGAGRTMRSKIPSSIPPARASSIPDTDVVPPPPLLPGHAARLAAHSAPESDAIAPATIDQVQTDSSAIATAARASVPNEDIALSSSPRRKPAVVAATIGVVLAIVATVLFLMRGPATSNGDGNLVSPAVTPSPSSTPSSTPSPPDSTASSAATTPPAPSAARSAAVRDGRGPRVGGGRRAPSSASPRTPAEPSGATPPRPTATPASTATAEDLGF